MADVLLWGLGGLILGFVLVWALMRLKARPKPERRQPMLKLEVKADIIHRRAEDRDELIELIGANAPKPPEGDS